MKSPNFTVGTRPKIGYVIHGTAGKYEGAVEWLCTPPEKRPVVSYSSAHYVVAKDGRWVQLVEDKDVSWHAGNVANPTRRAQSLLPLSGSKFLNPNESFIGIELEWFAGDNITEKQYEVIVEIIKKGGIKNPVLLTHQEITDYKSDFPPSMGVVEEITRRITANSAPQQAKPSTDAVTTLLTKLNSQIGVKDYKGARDTTSFLFTELTKLK